MKIKKLLIANRGEIAVRIIRSCRDLGISPVAVYSEADRAALHVLLADEAYPIGPAPANESYLRGDKLLAIAKQCGAQAIHPGYGFLSENHQFAQQCEAAKVIFVGPTSASLYEMGDKVRSREHAQKAGVPVVPGTPPLAPDADVKAQVKALGMPLLIKCSGGGGGHGMRFVNNESELEMALKMTRAEGRKAFGNDTVYIEKALKRPRHIEVQLFGYGDGKVVHLFTRACSVQRRHQKVVEEAPAPMVLAAKLRAIEQDAVKLASAINYRGAGTAEFLLDADNNHYFLEMNTRLQVEHAVTEMILSIDLVALQIQLAGGEALGSALMQFQEKQKPTSPRGHAIECRLYAENPLHDFAPSPGRIARLRLPQGPSIRVDSGIYEGFVIPVHYDPMIAKIIAWGPDRDTARLRLLRALEETAIVGIDTNLDFLKLLLKHAAFIRGDYSTDIIKREKLLETLTEETGRLAPDLLTATAAAYTRQLTTQTPTVETLSPWQLETRKAP